jgi:hypothetical protein
VSRSAARRPRIGPRRRARRTSSRRRCADNGHGRWRSSALRGRRGHARPLTHTCGRTRCRRQVKRVSSRLSAQRKVLPTSENEVVEALVRAPAGGTSQVSTRIGSYPRLWASGDGRAVVPQAGGVVVDIDGVLVLAHPQEELMDSAGQHRECRPRVLWAASCDVKRARLCFVSRAEWSPYAEGFGGITSGTVT